MTNNRFPTVGSGRLKEGGRLATDKQDFNAHWQGNGFRHMANQIDVSPIPNLSGANVQAVLEDLEGAITSKGTGYISIGQTDGYALGEYNVGSVETPTLADAFAAAFTDNRLQNGGIILVLAGTYHLRDTVTVPPGITIMGESSGTLIIGQMNEQPMFVVDYTTETHSIGGDSGSGPVTATIGSNLDGTGFANIMLADNLDGYVAGGGPSMVTVPMIQCKIASELTLDHVSFLGRLNSGTITGRSKTLSAISYVTGGGTGTSLKVNNCFFDGLKLAINFLPNHGASDFLTVKNCKARTYGTEDAGSTSASLNCFINISLCNASIIDNYYIGAGSQINTMITIASAGGSTAVNMVISGNYGGPNGSSGNLVSNLSGTSFKTNFSGNHWGQNLDNPWYLTVGGSSNGSPGGDIFGSGAIDIVLSLALNNSFSGTVIVNPGTYTVTGNASSTNNYANLKFIGNKNGKNYPVFNLNLSSSSADSLGNRPLALGNHIESIEFNSVTNRHSIRPGFNPTSVSAQTAGTTMKVVDCIFINTSLYALGLGALAFTDSLGNQNTTTISVKNCFFLQDGTFTDTISLVLPVADTTEIDQCMIAGNGYALSVGTAGYTSIPGFGTLSITNCIFDLTDHTITAGSLINSYIAINSPVVQLNMSHCRIYADNTYINGAAPISTAILNSGSFRFVYIVAQSMHIDHCDFVGVLQKYTYLGTDYATPTLRIEPYRTAKITNSKFIFGYLPLQVGGSGTLNDSANNDGIVIDSCQFNSDSQTLIDFDLAMNDVTGYTPFNSPYISITNCNLAGGSAAYPAYHALAIGSFYDTAGIVQIYGGQSNVFISHNNITGTLNAVSGFNNIVGIMVDNYHDPSATDGAVVATTLISNNSIRMDNNYTSATSTKAAACMLLRSSAIQVNNNNLYMNNLAAASSSFIGCLVLDNPVTIAGAYSDCMVTGNIFGRRSITGGQTNLVRGYISIVSTSGARGVITDNSFDSTTYDGSSTTLVEDNTSTSSKWLIERNKNQTSSLITNFAAGDKSVISSAFSGAFLLAGSLGSNSVIMANTSNAVTFSYDIADAGSAQEFTWAINLFELLPPGVRITGVSYTYQAGTIPDTTKTVVGVLNSVNGTDTNSTTITNTSSHTQTMTISSPHYTVPSSKVNFYLKVTIEDSSTSVEVVITNLTFTYRW
jgi:hypothetical protein